MQKMLIHWTSFPGTELDMVWSLGRSVSVERVEVAKEKLAEGDRVTVLGRRVGD